MQISLQPGTFVDMIGSLQLAASNKPFGNPSRYEGKIDHVPEHAQSQADGRAMMLHRDNHTHRIRSEDITFHVSQEVDGMPASGCPGGHLPRKGQVEDVVLLCERGLARSGEPGESLL